MATPIDIHLEGLDGVGAVVRYDERVARIVVAAKNRGRKDLLASFGAAMARKSIEDAAMQDAVLASARAMVTWVPASPDQRRSRGFDQGRLLARSVARHLSLPHGRLLTRQGHAQRGNDRASRLTGPDVAANRRSPEVVLLVDDVITTGASLRRAAVALRSAGACHIRAITFAAVCRSAETGRVT